MVGSGGWLVYWQPPKKEINIFETKEQPQDIYKDNEYPLDCSEVQLDPAWRSTGVGGEQSQSEGRISFLSC